jgi:hypothetical protein
MVRPLPPERQHLAYKNSPDLSLGGKEEESKAKDALEVYCRERKGTGV